MDEINLNLIITDPDNGTVYELDVKEDITAFELFNIYQLTTCYQQHAIMPHHDVVRYICEKGILRHFTKE
jgi:hypothetical protein